MAIKLEMLRYFVTVARSGNLTEAARSLGRTPSAISMMLKQFETHLNQPLFESERKSKLTAVGQFIFDEAAREIEHFDRTIATMERFTRAEAGYVRIAAVPSIANTILPHVIKKFIDKYPNIQIDVRDTDSEGVFRALKNERADIGLASKANNDDDFIHTPFIEDDYGIICHKTHPLASTQRPVEISALSEYQFISSGLTEQIAAPALQPIFMKSKLMVRNSFSLLAMIREGVGITILPELAIKLEKDHLAFLKIAGHDFKRQINIIQRANTNLSPATKEFIQVLREHANSA